MFTVARMEKSGVYGQKTTNDINIIVIHNLLFFVSEASNISLQYIVTSVLHGFGEHRSEKTVYSSNNWMDVV